MRALALAMSAILFGASALAEGPDTAQVSTIVVHRHGDLRVIDPWAKSAIGAHEAKLFFAFRNLGAPDRLVGVSSKVASGPALFHLVTRSDGKRSLQTLPHIPIPKTDTPFELSEVGYYIELGGLEVPLVMGKEFEVTLRFETAGEIAIPVTSRFHSPRLARRISEAVQSGDLEALRALRDAQSEASP